ncbi:Zinc-regulated transporter 1 [Coniochaeta hoffmannii]|uniref:Zinc-regulated transporter 1 n=1 Tax=Coniochaeta hoffmannii TaxID=91930 RepID=A0AA38VX67_9PEZI|nr:Zinc-regulated transporter 1 [Coniochaeta hoffmannii]
MADAGSFDPHSVDLDTADLASIICYVNAGGNDYDGRLGARISAVFVILLTSSLATVFPVAAKRLPRLHIPKAVYIFARYFGAGVIIATAFIHLLDPAYDEIGPASCVGLTGGWAEYTWPPSIALTSIMLIFLLDFGAEYYVERKYGFGHNEDVELNAATGKEDPVARSYRQGSHQFLHSADQDMVNPQVQAVSDNDSPSMSRLDNKHALAEGSIDGKGSDDSAWTERAFRQQIAAFLILEFGVIFHSVIIGLNLGVVGDEFSTLYPVIVFHQLFEGLGIGARLSVIPFPSRLKWMPWALCATYGLTTPISIAIGIGLSTQYNSGSFTANVVSGVLDSVSAGILIYTGLVELLARDFLFNKDRTRNKNEITLMLVCLFLGCGIMALLGKWA